MFTSSSSTRRIVTAASIAAAALCAGQARAQLPAFTITDGSSQLAVGALVGNRTTAVGGVASLQTSTGVAPVDHVFQNWFWYRTASDSREYALANQLPQSNASGNRAELIYSEPVNDGQIPDALRFELEYTLSDRTGPANRPETVVVTVAFKVRNMLNAPVSLQFFSYNDFDLNASAGGDRCAVNGTAGHIQSVGDPSGTQFEDVQALYIASATSHIAYEVDTYPNLLAALANGAVDNLSNGGAPFGPGDYSGANQWSVILAPAGQPQDTLLGSVTLEIRTNTCEADYDGNNQVNSSDISAFLSSWLGAINGGCP